jgi:NADH-quinone oxidoreductase subunit J
MYLHDLLFFLLVVFGLISSMMVVLTKNPVFSILFLILCFCDVSCMLFLLEIEYLPLMFLVIYVGAIAVLFLFVIMMLNIKIAEMKENSLHFLPIVIIFSVIFSFQINIMLQANFSSYSYNLLNYNLNNDLLLSFTNFTNSIYFYQKLSNIKAISFIIFTEYYHLLIIASLILLLGMVSTIVLTLQKKFLLKNQTISSQVLRDYNKQIVLYS